jgi:hypothetical protein
MAKMWTPKPQELLQQWIDDILEEASDNLSDWESSFVDSVHSQLNRKGQLSERQEEILEKIYAEKTK